METLQETTELARDDDGRQKAGKKMDPTALTILRIVNGKAVEGWDGYIHKTPQTIL